MLDAHPKQDLKEKYGIDHDKKHDSTSGSNNSKSDVRVFDFEGEIIAMVKISKVSRPTSLDHNPNAIMTVLMMNIWRWLLYDGCIE